jgi:hypothetical protein
VLVKQEKPEPAVKKAPAPAPAPVEAKKEPVMPQASPAKEQLQTEVKAERPKSTVNAKEPDTVEPMETDIKQEDEEETGEEEVSGTYNHIVFCHLLQSYYFDL